MSRLLAVLTLAVLAAPVVADIPPPPPPKGKKYVSVSNEVVLGKDVSGYVFVQQVTTVPGRDTKFSKLELTPGKAVAPAAGGRRTFVTLFAVPADAVKEFKSDEELFTALGANKVKGAVHIGLPSTATVPDTVKGDSVKWTHTITAISDKGVQTKVEGDGYEAPKAPKGDRPPGEEEEAPGAVQTPRGGTWVAGLAGALAVMLGGLWAVGRARRKV
jgi:hypothetical protein